MAFGEIDKPALSWQGRAKPIRMLSGPADSTYWDDPSALGPPGQAAAAGTPDPSAGGSTPVPFGGLQNLLGSIDFSSPVVLVGLAAAVYFFFIKGRR